MTLVLTPHNINNALTVVLTLTVTKARCSLLSCPLSTTTALYSLLYPPHNNNNTVLTVE